MKVTQLANQIADNASRIGDQSMLEDRKIYEADINDLFFGAHLQGGESIDLYEHGRVILSSVEVVPGTTDQQYIHWQRCVGKKNHTRMALNMASTPQSFAGRMKSKVKARRIA